MLSLKDCLDYCDLTDDEVDLLAEHEHLPSDVAAALACGLVQSEEGVIVFDQCMKDLVSEAVQNGYYDRAEHVLHVYAQFRAAHPLAQ